jgi:virulence-associated protein VagC
MILRKTYKQGDSTGVTIPKEFGIRPGIHVKFEQRGNKIVLETFIKDKGVFGNGK